MKSDIIGKYLKKMNSEEREWILGCETSEPLRYGFKSKRAVHPGIGSFPVMPFKNQTTWDNLVNSEAQNQSRAVYIHIPFCSRRCNYCGFFQNMSCTEKMDEYTKALIKDITSNAECSFIAGKPINAVYLGGGTPSALSTENIAELLDTIHTALPLANDCEVTFESSIHELDKEKFTVCLDKGVNRFSIGVQSFDTKVRQAAGRVDTRETVINNLKYMLGVNRASIVIDLMYGLPYQSSEIWENDLETQFELGLHGGDIYQLNVFPGSVLEKSIHSQTIPPAMNIAQQAEMYEYAVNKINARPTIKRLSVCHWAHNIRERSMYNKISLGGADIIPFGAGAGGMMAGYSIMGERNLTNYLKATRKGEKPIMGMLYPDANGYLYREITGQLDCGYLEGKTLQDKYNVDVFSILEDVFEVWQHRGFITMVGDVLTLTIAGQFWYVNLTQAILDCLDEHFNAQHEKIGTVSFMP